MYVTSLALMALAEAGTLGVGIHKSRSKSPHGRGDQIVVRNFGKHLEKRSTKYIPENMANGFYMYEADLYIGSDKQLVKPMIDTGSSDLWVMLDSNPYCTDSNEYNCTDQIYDPETSTSYKNMSVPYDIQYLDTTGAFGWFAKDDILFDGGSVLRQAEFAVANLANSSEGVFGIGFTNGESSIVYNSNNTSAGYRYPNLPVSMKDQGLIDRVAYSLYLNDVEAQEGEILFGGVDHAKYDGNLSLLPMLQLYRGFDDDYLLDFRMMLNAISAKSRDKVCSLFNDFAVPFLLDSGTSYAIMPPTMLQGMANAMNYDSMYEDAFYSGDCDTPFDFDTFEMNFMGTKVQVPPATLLDYVLDENNNYVYSNGKKQCFLAISGDSFAGDWILGDVFLRNFYVAYDLESQQFGLAQSNFKSENSDVEAISKGIPRATKAPHYASTSFQSSLTTSGFGRCLKATSSANLASSATSFTIPPSSTKFSAKPSSISSSSAYPHAVTSLAASRISSAVSVKPTQQSGVFKPGASQLQSESEQFGTIPTISSAGNNTFASLEVNPSPEVVTTTIVSIFTTSCPAPTTFSTNGQTYTATEATVITVTDCPCTLTRSNTDAGPSSWSDILPDSSSAGSIVGSHSASESNSVVTATTLSSTSATAETSASSSPTNLSDPVLANSANKLALSCSFLASLVIYIL